MLKAMIKMFLYKYTLSRIKITGISVPRSRFRYPRLVLASFTSAFCLLFLSSCQNNQECVPRIAHTYESPYDIPPPITPPVWIPETNNENVPWGWIPPSSVEKDWTAIIVHHSATEKGNAAQFDRAHKDLGWDGVGYDFVIGNGKGSGDGQVEVTFRWRQQITGAHCGTPDNWANEDGIGICLVGNFNNRPPSERQMQSLVKLTKFLQKRYGIFQSSIFGHRETRGAHITDCPGHMFPMAELKSRLNY